MKPRQKFTAFLCEDAPRGDITTAAVFGREWVVGCGVIRAKEDLVLSGLAAVKELCARHFPKTKTKFLKKDGDSVPCGTEVAVITGPAQDLLFAERTCLNLLQHLSGIATLTHKFVALAKPFGVQILDTRKTIPGLRDLEKRAVRDGGGKNHRMNLSDQYLIKDNHIALAGSVTEALHRVLAHRRKNRGKEKIEIEVRNLKELAEVLPHKPDIILLDNMSPAQIVRAVKMRNTKIQIPPAPLIKGGAEGGGICLLEISGGVTLKNLKSFLPLGVERISVGALTHSAVAVDLSMKIKVEK